jgi:nucleotidyltransferase/DNA polymerase involved in DNA repair
VRKINGIGPKASARLAKLGIATIAELAVPSRLCCRKHFGRSYAEWLHAAAHGIDEPPSGHRFRTKSISRETTFERDLHPAEIAPLCPKYSPRLLARRRRPAAQGLPRPHHRHQAALRGLPHRHARPDAAPAPPPTLPPSAAPPANACAAPRWNKSCACSACVPAP